MEYFSFGPFLWWSRAAYLSQLEHCKRALVLGDGDGRFTARLMRLNSEIEVEAVDVSGIMIDLLRKNVAINSDRLTTHVADLRTWKPVASARYDLIVTHFFLDCLAKDEVAALVAAIKPALERDAVWAVSEFAVPETPFGRLVARPVVAMLYWAFGWLTGMRIKFLPDHQEVLTAAGWSLRAQRGWLKGLLMSQLWQFDSGKQFV